MRASRLGCLPIGSGSRFAKSDFAPLYVSDDAIAVGEFAVEDLQRERIDDLLLQRALEWPCSVDGIVTFVREERFGLVGQFECNAALGHAPRQAAELDADD